MGLRPGLERPIGLAFAEEIYNRVSRIFRVWVFASVPLRFLQFRVFRGFLDPVGYFAC